MATQAERLKALEKVRAGARIGGKGSMRRKVKNVHKKGSDEKKLQATLKRLQVNNIPGIEEINMFRDDGTVIHFVNPRLQASIGANTYVISGNAQVKKLQDLLPNILSQVDPSEFSKLAEHLRPPAGAEADDDIPDLAEDDAPPQAEATA